MTNKPKAIDLFCGAGGLSKGFENAGFQIVAGFDTCKDSLNTFEKNHIGAEAILADLYEPIKNIEMYKDIDMVIGGPPCQGFSISGKRDPNDIRNSLYKAYLHTLKEINPKYFIMENVPNLVSMNNGSIKDTILRDISALGYCITYSIMNAKDFGVPQSRRRVFFIGTLSNKNIEIKVPNIPEIPSSDALSDLPENSLQDGSQYPFGSSSDYQKKMRIMSKEFGTIKLPTIQNKQYQ